MSSTTHPSTTKAPAAPQWHESFPTPSFNVPRILASELKEIMQTQRVGVDYIVVDARRTDFEDAFIKGAVNLPAHSFYPTLGPVTSLLSGIPKVIFHCNSCSATGRGPRVAGWYDEELKARNITTSKALVLDGGVKKFIAKYGKDDTLVQTLPNLN